MCSTTFFVSVLLRVFVLTDSLGPPGLIWLSCLGVVVGVLVDGIFCAVASAVLDHLVRWLGPEFDTDIALVLVMGYLMTMSAGVGVSIAFRCPAPYFCAVFTAIVRLFVSLDSLLPSFYHEMQFLQDEDIDEGPPF